ncbi:MAG TPA: GIY-YIG nuclease family protein [bacterium]|nr:GIY-YIG nuclease family protein [bacterium]
MADLTSIILSKILQYKLPRYLKYIDETLNLIDKNGLTDYIEFSRISFPCFQIDSNVLIKDCVGGLNINEAKFEFQFSNYYLNKEIHFKKTFSGEYDPSIKFKINDVNTRNHFTCALIDYVIQKQTEYLLYKNELVGRFLNMAVIETDINQFYKMPFYFDMSRISRMLGNVNIMFDDKKLNLKDLLFANKTIIKSVMENIINWELFDIMNLKIKRSYTDVQLKQLINSQLNSNYTRRYIAKIRSLYGIPTARERGKFLEFQLFSSIKYSLKYCYEKEIVKKQTPNVCGVYEIHLPFDKSVEYAKSESSLIYIGSSKQLKSRLLEHFNSDKNKLLYELIGGNQCFYRFAVTDENYAQIEKKIYDYFKSLYGQPPLCNKISPSNHQPEQSDCEAV